MAFIEVPSTIEAALQFVQEGSQMRNILNFRFPAVGPEQSMEGLMDELKAWYETDLPEAIAANVQMAGIKLTYLGVADGKVLEWQPSTTLYGSSVANSAPANVTLAIKLSSGFRGRSANGRVYIVGMPDDVTAGSYVTTVYRDAVVAIWEKLLDPAVIFAHKLCVVSRVHNGAPRTQGVTYDVIGMSANTVIDSQRRRLPGRGN